MEQCGAAIGTRRAVGNARSGKRLHVAILHGRSAAGVENLDSRDCPLDSAISVLPMLCAFTGQGKTLLYSPKDWFLTGGPMPRIKKPKKDKTPETTAEFISRVTRQDAKRNGLKRHVGHHHRERHS